MNHIDLFLKKLKNWLWFQPFRAFEKCLQFNMVRVLVIRGVKQVDWIGSDQNSLELSLNELSLFRFTFKWTKKLLVQSGRSLD